MTTLVLLWSLKRARSVLETQGHTYSLQRTYPVSPLYSMSLAKDCVRPSLVWDQNYCSYYSHQH